MTPTPEAIRKANEIVAKINASTNDDDDEGIIAQGLDEWAAAVWEEAAEISEEYGRVTARNKFRARAAALRKSP